ncbi:HNH endonuclease [Micromonospora sp. CA-263727]|uniref:HNH endonuclease n=1 Tax=Micromonospora sp. CA-263727 TaxID=3239967 RepID=UPI003D947C13
MASRNYPPAVRAALVSLSQGTCYYPGCPKKVLEFVGETPELNVDIAHICALKPDGPRYDYSMAEDERNSFDNLILLCKVHHRHVDQTSPERYPVDLLREWKENREANGRDVLRGLQGLTEERLKQLIAMSLQEFNDDVRSAIDKLSKVDFEAASVLKILIGQLNDGASRHYAVDPDAVYTLRQAAEKLSHLPDTAPMLIRAANTLMDARGRY